MQCQFLAEGVKFLVQMCVLLCILLRRMQTCLVKPFAFLECTRYLWIPDRECSASVGFDSNVWQYLYTDIGRCKCILACANGLGKNKVKWNCSAGQVSFEFVNEHYGGSRVQLQDHGLVPWRPQPCFVMASLVLRKFLHADLKRHQLTSTIPCGRIKKHI